MNDADRWAQDDIPYPDAIVVSGDIVQGAASNDNSADQTIREQYDEAQEFLADLATELIDSDRSKVVVVPGNHDVNWRRARQAMRPSSQCPENIETESTSADSRWRWNWQDTSAYEITDPDCYESRFQQFRDFQAEFYDGLEPNPLHIDHDVVFADSPSLDLAMVGFASWHGNDCFCRVGAIEPSSLSKTRHLLRGSSSLVRVAVWHHSIEGGPRSNDYMDRGVIERAVDLGFNVILHGHQHSAYATSANVPMLYQQSIAVISAGSFAVGDGQLPMGEKRQFNIVDIDLENESITTWVRAMTPAGVFVPSYRDEFGGESFVTLKLPRRRRNDVASSVDPPDQEIVRLDDAFRATEDGRLEDALAIADEQNGLHAHEKRQILIRAYEGLGRREELKNILANPHNGDELAQLVSLFVEDEQLDEAETVLRENEELIDEATVVSMTGTIAAKRLLK